MTPRVLSARLIAGTWEGEIEGLPDGAALIGHWQGREIGPLAIDRGPPVIARLDLPRALMSDGVQAVTVAAEDGTVLHRFALIAGVPPEEDLRAELALLRAELDLLARVVRRQARG